MGALVVLAAQAGAIEPGGEGHSVVLVRNTGTTADQFALAVQGSAASFATVEPAVLTLQPDQEASAWVTFRPPRSADVPAGTHPFSVAVASRNEPAFLAMEDGVVDVAAFVELDASLVPSEDHGTLPTLVMANHGNAAAEVEVVAGPVETAQRQPVEIPAGRSAAVTLPPGRRNKPVPVQVLAGDTTVADLLATPSEPGLRHELTRSAVALAVVTAVVFVIVVATQVAGSNDRSARIVDQPRGGAGSSTTLPAVTEPAAAEPSPEPAAVPATVAPPATDPPGPPPVAPAPASLGPVVLVRTYDATVDLVVRGAGGDELRLTAPDLDERRPALAPGRDRVAFVAKSLDTWSICVVAVTGGSYWCVADADATSSVRWAAADRLLYTRGEELFEVAAAAPPAPRPTPVRVAAGISGGWFSLSADGSRMAFVRDGRIVVRAPAGGDEVVIQPAGRPHHPALSPDGRTVAYSDGADVRLLAVASGAPPARALTSHPSADVEPAWSADGALVLFRSLRTGNGDLYAVPAAPGEPEAGLSRVTDSDLREAAPSA